MNKRELMETAAKAIRLEGFEWSNEHLCMVKPFGDKPDSEFAAAVYTWNPADDDDDSRRLQVKLKINLEFDHEGSHDHVKAYGISPFTSGSKEAACPVQPDPYKATRMAVLYVAAEIGKEACQATTK